MLCACGPTVDSVAGRWSRRPEMEWMWRVKKDVVGEELLFWTPLQVAGGEQCCGTLSSSYSNNIYSSDKERTSFYSSYRVFFCIHQQKVPFTCYSHPPTLSSSL